MAPVGEQVAVDPGAVPQTLLWTLHHRAAEARRPDAVIRDPMAVSLTERIDFPFAERFGEGDDLGQWQALRASAFDGEVRRFVAAHPGGTVVALGEGLETQFWRVDDGRMRWVTVDLPEVIDLRDRLLPVYGRHASVATSALDGAWPDAVDPGRGVLVTAQGLLMYLQPDEVHELIAECARRLPGASLVFDAVPRWLAARRRSGRLTTREGYRPPSWSWSMDAREERVIAAIPGVAGLRHVPLPRGRGRLHGSALPAVARVPPLRRLLLSVYEARLRPEGVACGLRVAGRRESRPKRLRWRRV